ncbi:hypothetical protein GXB85_05375 [Cellulomonas sp. APG4]|uniref:hypothetical protein n=1 Tax=Cellulomonas sp. APG4 TaxID=1538656 RepID=UPI00137A97DF|nr:hypothetical protein [Cellulomonas sp. APG4]NCT90382.1 hypothetical protein [Cellulomonas sp. APG4]
MKNTGSTATPHASWREAGVQPLQRFEEGTPATVEDFEAYQSQALRGVFPYRDVLFLVAEHIGIDVDEHLDLHVSDIAAQVVADLGEHRCVAGYRFTRWRTRRDPFGGRRREAMHEALYVPRAAHQIVSMAVATWRH